MTAIPDTARKRKSTKIFELKSVFAVNYVGRDLGTARVNHLLPLTYDSESEGKLTLKKLAADILLSNGKYYGFVNVNDTVMFA